MDGSLADGTLEVATARAALLRLLPELAFGAPSARTTVHRLLRLLTPPDWLTGTVQVSAELAAFVRVAEPIIAVGSWQVLEDTGSGEIHRTDEARLWASAHDRA